MSWDLILQLAALVLLGGIAALIGTAIWASITDTKHKRKLELLDRTNVPLDDMRWHNEKRMDDA